MGGETCPWPLPSRGVDLILLISVSALVLFGLLMVYSASFIYAYDRTGDGLIFIKKQMAYALVGYIGLLGLCRMDYRRWIRWGYPCLIAGGVLLLLVLFSPLGARVGGAQRWMKLGMFSFQPAEFMKIAVVLWLASLLSRKQEALGSFRVGILSPFLLLAPIFALLLKQPDFGTVAILVMVLYGMLYLAGVPFRYLISTLGVAFLGGIVLVLGSSYRLSRVLSFIDPWADPSGKGFQILQSFVGFRNGGLFGVGLGNGKEKLFFLPEAHNDFIFSVIGEELGFIGIAAVIAVFCLFLYRGLKIAWRSYERYGDRFGMYLAGGATLLLGLQGFVNMAVAVGLLPTKGLALPFVSYGGSALVADLFLVGILLSVGRGPMSTRA